LILLLPHRGKDAKTPSGGARRFVYLTVRALNRRKKWHRWTARRELKLRVHQERPAHRECLPRHVRRECLPRHVRQKPQAHRPVREVPAKPTG